MASVVNANKSPCWESATDCSPNGGQVQYPNHSLDDLSLLLCRKGKKGKVRDTGLYPPKPCLAESCLLSVLLFA